ncbi:hypothetical protein [Patulibacter sp.]|uniref:hypothetical protein n=1 Tax=Patulibacter sp. TaxID=1912859 RepID=UPI00272A08D0|nr:hypothetical protein [Patulibacter sp.]
MAAAAVAALLGAAPAVAAELPTTPTGDVQVSVTTASGWTVEDRGPKTFEDQRATQLVLRRPGGETDAVLYPESAAGELCDPLADDFHCMPMRTIFGPKLRMGKKGLVVTDQDADGVPEVAMSLFTGGAHCCVITVGYWRDASGAWKSDRTNGGSMGGDRADATGRVQIADPAFEGMDWSYAETQPYLTWSRLVPGTGWVDATTKAEHRREITSMTGAIRRFARLGDAEFAIQAARAVRIGHRKALGQTRRLAAERRTYRRAYGRGDLRTLDRALKPLTVVR